MPPVAKVNDTALDGRIELRIWWASGDRRRTSLDAFRPRVLTADDIAALPAGAK